MAILSTQIVDTDGLVATYTAASSGGDQCATGDGVFLHVKNAGAAAHTVELVTPQTVDNDLAVANRQVDVAAGTDAFIAVPNLYRDSSTGLASITYDSVEAGFDLAALRAG